MARPSGPKTRCGGQWTEARFRSFIRSALRSATVRWAPISNCKKRARVGRGQYKCECCGEIVPPTTKAAEGNKKKRVSNIYVDHVDPIVDPDVGFTSWDDFIERMFCEEDNLELLCKRCHDEKSKEERERSYARIEREKSNE